MDTFSLYSFLCGIFAQFYVHEIYLYSFLWQFDPFSWYAYEFECQTLNRSSYGESLSFWLMIFTFKEILLCFCQAIRIQASTFIKSGIVCIFGDGSGNPLQYSCLENPMDKGAWWVAVHGVTRSLTRLSDFTFTFHFHALEKEMATHSTPVFLPGESQGRGSLVGCRLWGCTESGTTEAT